MEQINSNIDILIVVVYLVFILGFGIWAGRGVSSLGQFSVADRGFGRWVIFATLAVSFIGGGFSMGNAEKVFLFGLMNIFVLWGFSLKEMMVAKFVAPRMGNFSDAISVGDIMERNYGKTGKVVAGCLGVMVCMGILGAQVGAIGYIFKVFLGIPKIYGVLVGCGIVIAYSAIGGMRAVVYTDIAQFIILSIGIPLTFVLGLIEVGGISAIQASVPASHLSLLGTGKTWLEFASLFLAFFLGETLVPPYVQRLFLSKNPKETQHGTYWSAFYSIPFLFITGSIGLIALTLNPNLDATLSLPYVITTVLPVGLKGLVVAGIISIVMSSADSFLNAGAMAFIHDFIKPLKQRKFTPAQELTALRVLTLAIGIGSVAFALSIKSVLDILLYTYSFWAPVILVPLAAVVLGVQSKTRHFIIGAVTGGLGVLIWSGILNDPFGLDGLIIGVFCNAIAFFSAYLLDKKNKTGK